MFRRFFQSQNWKSFKLIIFAALIVRLIAAIFSQGFGMFDDHFLVIEASSSWANNYDYDNWLPWSPDNHGPLGHSFSYVGLNYLYFEFMQLFGVEDPKILMLVNRIIHAFVSLIVVWYAMKITLKLSDLRKAKIVGWLLALCWAIPFLSVRNLVEMTAIPWLIVGMWVLIRDKENKWDYLIAGLLIGMSASFRYQVGIFAVGIAAIYFFRWQWKPFIHFCLGVVTTFVLTQGVVDYFVWGYPFAEFIGYFLYNTNDGMKYLPNSNYGMYFMVLSGLFLIPLGLLLLTGFFRSWKKHILIFVPTLMFILFHTIYPNRQERFVLSVLPFFVILGVLGYHLFKESKFRDRLWKGSFIAFWVLNIPLLAIITTMYSKKSRVESMYSLYPFRHEPKSILMEGTGSGRVNMMPKFYAGDWHLLTMDRTDTITPMDSLEQHLLDYIFFFEEQRLDERIAHYKTLYPKMTLLKECPPSLVDYIIYKINPVNKNETIQVWKTNRLGTKEEE